jgi:hypothetical protein
MRTELHERFVVHDGRIDLPPIDLPDGTEVEVTIEPAGKTGPADATDHLLSTEANREAMKEALRELERPETFIPLNVDEYEKRLTES